MAQKKLFRPVSSTSGFSLLEALVVIIMLGVVAGIAAPGWLSYVNRQRINRARTELAQVLQQAQVDARQQNQTRVVKVFSNNPPQLEVSSTPDSNGRVIELGEQNSGLNLEGGPLGGAPVASVTFDYKGTVINSNVPFVFSVTSNETGNSSVRCVVVSTLLGNLVQAEGEDCNDTSGLN